MTKIVSILVAVFLTIGIFSGFIMYMNAKNTEIQLVTRFDAEKKDLENVFDSMWKILKQQAGVTDQYKNAFREIYPSIIAGRYQGNGDGSLMKMVQESNPEFDTKMYERLMESIESQRIRFENKQREVIDIEREHNTFIQTFPNSLFLGGVAKIDFVPVTSGRAKDAIQTGEDNDVDLFDKTAATPPAPASTNKVPAADGTSTTGTNNALKRLPSNVIVVPPMPAMTARRGK
jgi:hypothetical protein